MPLMVDGLMAGDIPPDDLRSQIEAAARARTRSAMPACSSLWRSTASAVGDRQMLPVHTNRTP